MEITRKTLRVLAYFCANPSHHWFGLDLISATEITPGGLYPILMRLERNGWLEGNWEVLDKEAEGGPVRRYYVLTELGLKRGKTELTNTQEFASKRPWYAIW